MRIIGSCLVLVLSLFSLVLVFAGDFFRPTDRSPDLLLTILGLLALFAWIIPAISEWRRGQRALALCDGGLALFFAVWWLWIAQPLLPADQQGVAAVIAVPLLLGAIALSALYLYTRW